MKVDRIVQVTVTLTKEEGFLKVNEGGTPGDRKVFQFRVDQISYSYKVGDPLPTKIWVRGPGVNKHTGEDLEIRREAIIHKADLPHRVLVMVMEAGA